jgi:hypothetical protein
VPLFSCDSGIFRLDLKKHRGRKWKKTDKSTGEVFRRSIVLDEDSQVVLVILDAPRSLNAICQTNGEISRCEESAADSSVTFQIELPVGQSTIGEMLKPVPQVHIYPSVQIPQDRNVSMG